MIPNLKKVEKLISDRKKEKRNRYLSKNPDKASLENVLFDVAESAKEDNAKT